ncbi:hypothetical protein IQ230_12985 [Gloeocapsopsis crepidinum LEGE 06123]|uniref:Iron-sulfur cluster biosynthesis family protein n=1 Tax=Gloeocapsopsis crepidinum LEGE 06123 TaxID=588587 RepID=A0ABR9USH5_9CHRO|nr:hypothetical protein [Gloeocapsopsis crepidinum]MBE9191251.1 hypothetical protein [Gloeocapsopsis crepidinum LEGE 06123]
MAPNPTIIQAVEQLGYRVTVGDVATQSGLNVSLAQQGLLTLASEAGGHMQVAESGEIVYQFPKNLHTVLRNKFWRLRLQAWWQKVWRVLFYLIRISFGIVLLLSIAIIFLSIVIIISAANRDNDNRSDHSGGGMMYMPRFWIGPNWYWFFYPDYGRRYQQQRRETSEQNFLEAIFSFLFGDGNPNADLEEQRWQTIGTIIRNNQGAVVAEQIAPYLDEVGTGYAQEYEDYMLPVLTRFNGQPVVSPQGQLVYHFPELQVSASQRRSRSVAPYLQESLWRFSTASSGQIALAAGLGLLNFVGAVFLGSLLADGAVAAELGGLVAFAQGIYWLLLGYGTAFLAVPLVRYFWIKWRNRQISDRNHQRQLRAGTLVNPDATLQQKMSYAKQFSANTVITQEDLIYTTETDLLEQEAESDSIDAEWQRRLRRSDS